MKKLLLIGNCQTNLMTQIARVISQNIEVKQIHSGTLTNEENYLQCINEIKSAEWVFSQPLHHPKFKELVPEKITQFHESVALFSTLTFQGYHPDCVYLNLGKIKSPIGDYHSSIVTLAYKMELNEADTLSLFNSIIYNRLGYYDLFKTEIKSIETQFNKFNLEPERDFSFSFKSEKMMHTINHPKLELLEELTKALFRQQAIPYNDISTIDYLVDNFPNSAVFPLYPEIAEKLHLKGSYLFKSDDKLAIETSIAHFDLSQFISKSFEIYNKAKDEDLSNARYTDSYLQSAFQSFRLYLDNPTMTIKKNHPYKGKPDYCFWKKSISSIPKSEVDPVVDFGLTIKPNQKIATAGSCFAQHIAKKLSASGYNYYVAETAPAHYSPQEASQQGYNVFSARYGNLYTTRQLLQLFDRAFGAFETTLKSWQRPDLTYVDPFRPQITPEGFKDIESLLASQQSHLSYVKDMFENLDVFVFTLGLTEAWRHKEDGSIIPIAPGITGGEMDPSQYEYINFTKSNVKKDLVEFIEKLKLVNPKADIILTISPVPLMATFEDRHVLVSTTVSKSILRVVADEICHENTHCHYFPSYEIITGNFNRGDYYADDLREVKPEGVDHVMRLFMQHCTSSDSKEIPTAEKINLTELEQIICDEELLHVD